MPALNGAPLGERDRQPTLVQLDLVGAADGGAAGETTAADGGSAEGARAGKLAEELELAGASSARCRDTSSDR